MKKIKEIILKKSLELFNKFGVAEVSIRQISSEIGISHSNLIYHFKTKQDIIISLHGQLLNSALELNNKSKSNDNFIDGLLETTEIGFQILHDYRFLMIEINHIMRENEKLKQIFLEVEKIRASMYKEAIQNAISQGFMREEVYDNEYDNFIEHIKIFSDFWISSSEIYDTGDHAAIIKKYSNLFVTLFYPYLTEEGRKKIAGSLL